ncbi:hypothetical protein BU14_0469s0002 [Porphyra umbilicalis]|uniref:Uncharacterized protein n=1 Tax=Porphyra umbilicalis TaxID=2786 RepID=A0A1X6NU09_PORUM|nr:hypothetical protein BU14_0469s0002 [Porphyra umbilicalis]|eukprot:OSX72088.1 hypothetical protein BU14_0469s0002 [Porphyra umbilicalis]
MRGAVLRDLPLLFPPTLARGRGAGRRSEALAAGHSALQAAGGTPAGLNAAHGPERGLSPCSGLSHLLAHTLPSHRRLLVQRRRISLTWTRCRLSLPLYPLRPADRQPPFLAARNDNLSSSLSTSTTRSRWRSWRLHLSEPCRSVADCGRRASSTAYSERFCRSRRSRFRTRRQKPLVLPRPQTRCSGRQLREPGSLRCLRRRAPAGECSGRLLWPPTVPVRPSWRLFPKTATSSSRYRDHRVNHVWWLPFLADAAMTSPPWVRLHRFLTSSRTGLGARVRRATSCWRMRLLEQWRCLPRSGRCFLVILAGRVCLVVPAAASSSGLPSCLPSHGMSRVCMSIRQRRPRKAHRPQPVFFKGPTTARTVSPTATTS